MHREVRKFVKEVRAEYPHKFRLRDILEVGAHNLNGSIRSYFWLCKWTGVDISKGKNVDIVGNFNDIPFNKKFQVIVCCEVFEHDATWRQSLKKMYDLLMPGGLLIITCAGPDRTPHGTVDRSPNASPDTTNYYGNVSIEEFREVINYPLFEDYVLMYARGRNDLQFYGIKPYEYVKVDGEIIMRGKPPYEHL